MKDLRYVVMVALVLLTGSTRLVSSTAGAAECEPAGDVRFVCGLSGPEDLVAIPDSEWVIASSYQEGGGGLRLVNTRDLTATVLLPTATPAEQLDAVTYAGCPGPIASVEGVDFRTHGLYLKPGDASLHTLYTVHHGSRESIEVFRIDMEADPPALTWVGCAVAPAPLDLNSVVALPDGGFAATSFTTEGVGSLADARGGKVSGAVWEWHPDSGWTAVPGSETPGPNGLEISPDGRWFYIGAWGSSSFVRLSRGRTPVEREEVSAGFHIDNLRWAPDGTILATGQAFGDGVAPSSRVARVDPQTLELHQLISHPVSESFGMATTAIQIDDELWVGSLQGTKVARFPAP